jgi:hypothetical protein
VRHHAGVPGAVRRLDRFERLSQGPDLIDLDQERIGHPARNALLQDGPVRHKQIIADELHLRPERVREGLPPVAVTLGHAVLNRDDRITAAQLLVEAHHPGAIERSTLSGQHIAAVLEELARGCV